MKDRASKLLESGLIDAFGMSVIDFTQGSFEDFELLSKEEEEYSKAEVFYDIASLTKVLTNAFAHQLKGSFSQESDLALNHRGGIVSWGLLPRKGWKEQILRYQIKPSATDYSDFSALRYQLDFEEHFGESMYDVVNPYFSDVLHWLDLTDQHTLINGQEKLAANRFRVHDPNARNISERLCHAGLFASLKGLSQTLLNFHQQTDWLLKVKNGLTLKHRFEFGLDRVMDPQNTLAGLGASEKTVGHLGFTGCSFWVDLERMTGVVILSNITKNYWFRRQEFNELRKSLNWDQL